MTMLVVFGYPTNIVPWIQEIVSLAIFKSIGWGQGVMVDYYTELGIDRGIGITDINKELSKLESIWRRRELTNPDKAARVIALILEAREIFRTEESRRQYDRKLKGEDKKDEQRSREEQSRLQLEKNRNDAVKFFESEQYDLALLTVNNALSFMSALGIEDDSILSLAADIYRCNGDNQSALNLINRAILVNSTDCMHYVIKAEIVGNLGYSDQKRNNLKIAISVAEQNGSLRDKANVLGVYSRSLYFNYPQDRINAIQYAKEALRLGESWGNAQAVIEAAEKADQQMRQQQKEADRLARQKAEEETRLAKQRADQEEARKQAEEKKRRHDEPIKIKQKRWSMLFALSIILFILYCLCPSLLLLMPTLNPNILLIYYLACSSLMCMSSAANSGRWPVVSYGVGAFCFGPASIVNGEWPGHMPLPFGKFMIAWFIIVAICAIIGKRIGQSIGN